MKPDSRRLGRGYLAVLLVAVASIALQPATAGVELTPHAATYDVKISVVSGELRTELRESSAGIYVATHVVAPTGMSRLLARGSISETSVFARSEDGLVPIAYRSSDSLSRDKGNADIRFDWDRNEASGTVDGQSVVAALDGLSHDRVSIQYELMYDLLNGSPGTQYQMFEVDRLRPVSVRSVGTREVTVAAGRFEAIGIQHQAENSSRVTTLWCVEALGYLPVIIEQHRKGKLRVRATLQQYTPYPSGRPGGE